MSGGEAVEDRFLDGRLRLLQFRRGHRAGTDAILLAAAAGEASGRAVDAGAGVGAAGLAMARRCPAVDITLVEIDPAQAALARRNIDLNEVAGRGRVVETDFLDPRARRLAGLEGFGADLVICNPPWLDPTRARVSPDGARALAHATPATNDGVAGVHGWLRAAAAVLKADGRLVMIHRADMLGDLLSGCEGRFGDLRVLPIYPRPKAPAIRVLLQGCRGSRAPLRLLRGLTLHEEDGSFTLSAEAIHRGASSLSFE